MTTNAQRRRRRTVKRTTQQQTQDSWLNSEVSEEQAMQRIFATKRGSR